MEEHVIIVDREREPRFLYRSRTNRVVAGVCGGLGEFLGIDPAIIRLIWLMAMFIGGTGILAYIVLALIIPEETREHAQSKTVSPGWGAGWQRSLSQGNLGVLIGLALILLGGVLILDNLGLIPGFVYQIWHLFWRLFWPLMLIILGIVMIVGLGGSSLRLRDRLGGAMPLRRSRDRILTGVCGGIGEYLGIDPTIVRVLWVLGSLMSFGAGALAYLVLTLVMPDADDPLVPRP
ncbi:MAG: hypothetical protein Kow0047_00940 [Anaerolineae bacterium]